MFHDSSDSAASLLGGAGLSLLLAVYGLWVLASGQATLRGRGGGLLVLTDLDALLYGACILSLAAAISCFRVWPRFDRVAEYAGAAAAAALLAFIGLLAVLVARQFLAFI